MSRKFKYGWLLLLAPLAFLIWYFIAASDAKPARELPVYGPKVHGEEKKEHHVPPFSFIDQNGNTFTDKDVEGKISVVEFFFTTCQSICPIMNDNLQTVYKTFGDAPDVIFLSHTVDPETDSVEVLREYAASKGATDGRWMFLTGPKRELYVMARKGYLLDDGAEDPDAFVHTQNFALVDKEKRIRGFYDGTDSLEVRRLVQDLNVLRANYRYHENR